MNPNPVLKRLGFDDDDRVVILHAVYGLTDHIGDVCARWAQAGYAAVAPALYDRHGRGVVHPYSRTGADAGIASYEALTEAQEISIPRKRR